MSQTIICILVLVLVLDRNQERQMIRRKKFSLLQIQNISLYFAAGQEVSGHFSISHQRCCWATVSLISQQPRLAQYFASNPIICESFSAILQIKRPKKKKKHTSRSYPKNWRSLEEVQWKKLGSFLCVWGLCKFFCLQKFVPNFSYEECWILERPQSFQRAWNFVI